MKVYLERTQKVPDQVSCNMCGCQMRKNDFGYFEDHLSVVKTWGYGTIADGETHSFDFCFNCYTNLVNSFAVPPHVLAGMHEVEAAR